MEQIQEGKLNWKPNLSCCKKYNQKEYHGLLLVTSHSIFFTELQNQQRKKCNVVFFLFFIFVYLFIYLFIYFLSESSESYDYSCNFCQNNSRFWTTEVNVNSAVYIVSLPFCCILSSFFSMFFYMVLAHLRLLFWVFSHIKLSNMPKIILIKSPTLTLCLYLLK